MHRLDQHYYERFPYLREGVGHGEGGGHCGGCVIFMMCLFYMLGRRVPHPHNAVVEDLWGGGGVSFVFSLAACTS